MKKALTIISSAVLAAAAVLPAYGATDLAKKVVSPEVAQRTSMAKAVAKKAPAKGGFHIAANRKAPKTNPLKMARKTATLKTANKLQAPQRVAANFPEMYGLVTYADDWTADNMPALCKFNNDGTYETLFNLDDNAWSGVACDGIYWVSNYADFWLWQMPTMKGYDIETGEQVASFYPEVDNLIYAFASDPSSGNIYSIGYNADGNGLQLATVEFDLETGMTVNAIAPIEGNWNSLVCSPEGQLYGVRYFVENEAVTKASLYKIDKTNASLTEVGDTGFVTPYFSSAAIDPRSGVMYWAVSDDFEGFLTEVNLTTGAATKLFNFNENAEVQGMYIAAPAAEDGAPAIVNDLAADFSDGSLSGNINFTAPTSNYDGSAASGSLTYNVSVNGESYATGTTQYGAEVSVPVTVETPGHYTFSVTVANSVGNSPIAKVSMFVGNGTPAGTTATLVYENGEMKLTWTPVTETIDGGYMDPAAVTYKVTRFPDDVEVYNGSATSFTEAIAVPNNLTTYYYTVEAQFDGVSGAIATSNSISLGDIVPPYSNDFSSENSIAGFTVIDANEDGDYWRYNEGAVRIQYNRYNAMDDWFVTPGIKMEAGKMYRVSFSSKAYSANYLERIEVKWGDAPTAEAMTGVVLDPTDILTTDYVEFENYITPTADGVYYIGFHGISDADTYYLYIDDLAISAPMTANAPAEVTSLQGIPSPDGDLTMKIVFDTPTVTMVGEALESLTEVTVSRDGEVVKTFENPGVGVRLVFNDTLEEGGNYNYTVVASNEEGAGKSATIAVFVGVNQPGEPQGIILSEVGNTGTVVLTWDEVTKDINGYPLNPEMVKYIVAEQTNSGWAAISEELSANTFTYDAVPAGEQDFVQLAVFAVTEGGQTGAVSDLVAVGTPYNGMEESFADGSLHYIWGTGYAQYGGAWSIFDDDPSNDITSSDGDNGYAAMKGEYLESSAGLFTGKISLANFATPGVSFYTYNINAGNPDINQIQVYVREEGTTEWVPAGLPIVIDALAPGQPGWYRAAVSLDEYKGKTVQVRFQATTYQYVYTMLDQIVVGDLLNYDVAIKNISAPAEVVKGAVYSVNVDIVNNGLKNADNFKVDLYGNGELVQTHEITSLYANNSATVSFQLGMPIEDAQAVTYYAEVVYADDQEDSNNTSKSITVQPKEVVLPAVNDLAGTIEDNGIKLTWTAPSAGGDGGSVSDDFEDADSWAHEYGDWTFIDKDNAEVGGFQGIDIPGVEAGADKASFFIFDSSEDGFNTTFAGHSGDKYLAALFRADDGTTDDWAISPMLSGNAQTISFFAKSYSEQYPEKIEMYYTLEDDPETTNYVLVKTVNSVPADWTEYTFEVPVGAKHFAIRSCATGSFMLMMDDFTYEGGSGAGSLDILGYNVYRNGVKINEELVTECEYLDENALDITYTYTVVTVYANGVSAPSNECVIEFVGVEGALAGKLMIAGGKGQVMVAGAAGEVLNICAADGKVIFNGVAADREAVAAPAGVYVVTVAGKTVKVAVK